MAETTKSIYSNRGQPPKQDRARRTPAHPMSFMSPTICSATSRRPQRWAMASPASKATRVSASRDCATWIRPGGASAVPPDVCDTLPADGILSKSGALAVAKRELGAMQQENAALREALAGGCTLAVLCWAVTVALGEHVCCCVVGSRQHLR